MRLYWRITQEGADLSIEELKVRGLTVQSTEPTENGEGLVVWLAPGPEKRKKLADVEINAKVLLDGEKWMVRGWRLNGRDRILTGITTRSLRYVPAETYVELEAA